MTDRRWCIACGSIRPKGINTAARHRRASVSTKCSDSKHNARPWERCQIYLEDCKGWIAVSCRQDSSPVEEWELLEVDWKWSCYLPGCRNGVPLCGDLGIGRKCCSRQQEEEGRAQAPSACHPQRRGAQQTSAWCDDLPGRCAAQHQPCPPAKEIQL